MLRKILRKLRKFGGDSAARVGEWRVKDDLRVREYPDYETYIRHQASKLTAKAGGCFADVIRWDDEVRTGVVTRAPLLLPELQRGRVLCLAARLGGEVRGFLEAGHFAVGVDLNPGDKNRYVVTGDFHELQYPADLFDVVFCNSIDHCFDLKKMTTEIRRVLHPSGLVWLEMNKKHEGKSFESLGWTDFHKIAETIESYGFRKQRELSYKRRETDSEEAEIALVFQKN